MTKLLLAAALLGLAAPSTAAPVVLSNDAVQLGVNGGEAFNGLIPSNGFFNYYDLASGDETTWSVDPVLVFADGSTLVLSNGANGGFGSPALVEGDRVRSAATRAGVVAVTADVELAGTNARATFSFEDLSGSGLDGITFLYYAENDLNGVDDAAAFTGSIATGDLALFQYDSIDGGLTVKLSAGPTVRAPLRLFGAGAWTAWGTALEAGDLSVLSANGSNFATSGDLGQALAFELRGDSASVVVNYDTQPDIPTVVIGGGSEGARLRRVRCINQVSDARVSVRPVRGRTWTCDGLDVVAGDAVQEILYGTVPEVAPASIGGTSDNAALTRVRCVNETTGQSVSVRVRAGAPFAWTCTGLSYAPGDEIRQTLVGTGR